MSAFDYISFLPGALSAYRYHAMLDNSYGPGPLTMYLRPGGTTRAGLLQRNIQFTEDQILFFEIAMKKGERWWALRLVKSAKTSVFKETA